MKADGCRAGFLFFISMACVGCSPYFPPPEHEGGWRKNTDPGFVRSLGLDPEKLEEFGRFNLSVENSNWKPYSDFKGILVIKDGWVVGEWYNVPEASRFRTYLSSNGKSFAMMAFGILAEDARTGRIDLEIDERSHVYDTRWLPEGFPLSDPGKSDITFDEIFQHTSGICPERSAAGEDIELGRNEWTDYVDWVVGHDSRWPETGKLSYPPGQPRSWPGSEVWGDHSGGYSSVSFGHIGLVLQNVYGMPASRFLWQRLLEPLGFTGVDFHAPPSRKIQWFSAGGLRLTPRDYARFAYFLLRDGEWRGRQIVPFRWVRRFTESIRYPNLRSNRDGFFGRYPEDMFRIAGSGLNWAFIIPSMNLIALRTGRSDNRLWDSVEQEFLQKLFDAVLDGKQWKEKLSGTGPAQIIASSDRPRWLWRRDGRPFFMAGPGDPEGFLYRGDLNADGTRSGDQMELIGALKGTGANCIYLMAVRSHGGDGDETQNPFVGHEPVRGLSGPVLDQWETWFTLLDRYGIAIFFFFFDDGARFGARHQALTALEKGFIAALVNRYKHHRNLIWCIAEEYEEAFTPDNILEFAAEIRRADENGHPVAVHKLAGTDFSEFRIPGSIDQFAMQLGDADHPAEALGPGAVHEQVLEAWNRSEGRYNLNLAELAHHYAPADRELTRRRSWAAAMAGASVMVIGMEIAGTPKEYLQDCGHLVRFFESCDFTTMEPHDELAAAGTEYVLARPGVSYIAYSGSPGGRMGLRSLPAGRYRLRWYNCGTGQSLTLPPAGLPSGNHVWQVPEGLRSDVALHLVMAPESP